MRLTVEFVHEFPWEREARLLGLNNLPARSQKDPEKYLAGKKQKTQEKTALSGRYLLGTNWLPFWNRAGNKLSVEKRFKPSYCVLPDPARASLGAKLRFLRREKGLTILELARKLRMGSETLSRLERGASQPSTLVLSRILTFFQDSAADAFPGTPNIFDQVAPVKDFASWLRNFRLRRGLEQAALAQRLGVHKVTICRYERNHARPDRVVVERLRKAFGLNGELDRFL